MTGKMGSVNFIAGGGGVKECWAKAFYLVRGFAEGVITTAGLGMTVRRAPAGGMADQPIDGMPCRGGGLLMKRACCIDVVPMTAFVAVGWLCHTGLSCAGGCRCGCCWC